MATDSVLEDERMRYRWLTLPLLAASFLVVGAQSAEAVPQNSENAAVAGDFGIDFFAWERIGNVDRLALDAGYAFAAAAYGFDLEFHAISNG